MPRRTRKLVKSKPPEGYVPWDEAVFDKLVASPPEPLVSHLQVNHATLLNVLDRPGDGCAALARLLTDNDETAVVTTPSLRQAIAIYRSLIAAGALERLACARRAGPARPRHERPAAGLRPRQPAQPVRARSGPTISRRRQPTWPLDVMSVVEATLDNPGPVLMAQLDRVKTEALAALKAAGVEYEERIEALDKLEYPKPLREWTYDLFDTYRLAHPWAGRLQHPAEVGRPAISTSGR